MEENQLEVKAEELAKPAEPVKQEPVIDLDKPLVEKKLKGKVRSLRNAVIACYYISTSTFFAVMGYMALTMILAMFVPDLNNVFFGQGANAFTLGIAGIFGILYYIFVIGMALLPIAIGFMFRNGKANYVRVLKGANKENMEIVFARLEYISMLIYEIILNVLIFFAILVCFTNDLTIVGILLCVTLVVSLLFNILVIADLIRNRVAYNNLSDEEREEMKVKIKSFRKVRRKKERKKEIKRRAGKLY